MAEKTEPTRQDELSLDVWVDRVADQFEAQRQAGNDPDIADFLPAKGSERRIPLLCELIRIDVAFRAAAGESLSLDDYDQYSGDDFILVAKELSGVFPPAVPKSIGKFEVLELLGEGAFGAVYKARDTELDRIVALKIPRDGAFAFETERERFIREARAVAQLQHPGIVQIHDIGHEGKLSYIVSDFVDGETLAELLDKRRLEPRETAELVRKLAEALQNAHEQGVIHRDVKPSNVLIDIDGAPRLADFGMARREGSEIAITLEGQILGTPAYMSPEQAQGKTDLIDARSDVYSLGVVLYEILTGERPFRGTTRMLLNQVLNDEPRPPRRLNDRIPIDLETICMKCLEKVPDRRYPTANELSAELSRYLNGEPITARPISKLGRLIRICKRNPRTSALSAVIAAGLLVAAVAATITSLMMSDLAKSEKRERTRAEVQTSRSLAESGILRLQNGNALGLLDLQESFEPVADQADELRSRARLTSGWIAHIEGRLTMLVGEDIPLSGGAFSADGNVFATCTNTGTLQVWDTATGQPLTQPLATRYVNKYSKPKFSGDGNLIAVVPKSYTQVSIWDWTTDPPQLVTYDVQGHCREVELLNDGTFVGVFVSTVRFRDWQLSFIRLWNLESNSLFAGPFPSSTENPLFKISHDGKTLAVFSRARPSGFWDLKRGIFRATKTIPHTAEFTDSAFSPDGKRFATSSYDNLMRIWSVPSADLVKTLPHAEDVRDLAFSPDGKVLASASFGSQVILWNTNDFEQIGETLQHDGPVLSVEFNRDGTRVASGGFDTRVRVWSVPDGRLIDGPFDHQKIVQTVQFHPLTDRLLSVSNDGTARIWNRQQRQTPVRLIEHPHRVWSIDFSPNGEHLATSSENGLVFIWDVDTGNQFGTTIHHGTQSLSARFNPTDGDELITTGGTIKFWNLKTGASSRKTQSHASFRSTRLAANGEYLVVGTDAAGGWLFVMNSGQAHQLEHPGPVHDVAFHPDSERFATACDDGMVRVFSASNLSQICQPLGHHSSAEAVAFSPDGKLIATASRDMSIQLWRTKDWQAFGTKIPQNAYVQALAFSPDSQLLAAATASGLVQIWDVQTGLHVGQPFRHNIFATSVQFSPDARLLATGSFDKTVRLWQLPRYRDESEIETLKLRIGIALGARKNSRGDIMALTGPEWQRIRDQLDRKR